MRDRLPDLVAEGLDFAVKCGEPEPSTVVARKLLDVRVVTCAAPAYFAQHRRPKDPREIGDKQHQCILFRDPTTGRPFEWEFHNKKGRIVRVPVSGRFTVNDFASGVAACLDGFGIAQFFDFVVQDHLRAKALVEPFPEWGEERYPVYMLYPSRHLPPAKVRAFADFLIASTAKRGRASTRLRPSRGWASSRGQ